MPLSPYTPVRSDHRMIRKVIGTMYGTKMVTKPSEYDQVSRVFVKAGGSWEKLFRGSPDDLQLLHKVIKIAVKKGYLTKKEPWLVGEPVE